MSVSRASPSVPVNRTLVGVLSLTCLATSVLMSWSGSNGSAAMWQGAFFRVGTVLAAFWLALPSRTREAAWARVPVWQVVGGLLVVLAVARSPTAAKVLIPLALALAGSLLLLRPRRKFRPPRQLFD